MKNALLVLLVMGLASCDYTMVTIVRNHRENTKVNVVYDTSHIYANSDTLHYQSLDSSSTHGFFIRTNTSATSYTFTIPANTQVVLGPLRLGNAISQVEVLSSNSVIRFNTGVSYKELKKKGIIEMKGFPFTHTIIINNR